MGSFMTQAAGLPPEAQQAIKEALDRRGMGDSQAALNTQSTASPTASPLPPQPVGGQSMSMPEAMPQPTEAMTAQGNPEAKMILGAMKEYLARITPLGGTPGKQPSQPSGGMA